MRNRRAIRAMAALGLSLMATALAVPAIMAQSAQPWSVQASVLAGTQRLGVGSTVPGAGFEAQFRYTPPALWSVGAGVQGSSHVSGGDTLTVGGVFLEPRYAFDIGSDRIAPYAAGRLAVFSVTLKLDEFPGHSFESTGNAWGGGAGLLVRATHRVNFDVGGAFVRQNYKDATSGGFTAHFSPFTGWLAKAGVSIGFGSR